MALKLIYQMPAKLPGATPNPADPGWAVRPALHAPTAMVTVRVCSPRSDGQDQRTIGGERGGGGEVDARQQRRLGVPDADQQISRSQAGFRRSARGLHALHEEPGAIRQADRGAGAAGDVRRRHREPQRADRLLVFEPHEQLAQQPGQLVALGVGERGEQDVLVAQVHGRDPVEQLRTFVGEGDEHPPGVVAAGAAGDDALALEAPEPHGDGAGGEPEPGHEYALRQDVRPARTAQCGDDGEVGRAEVVAREHRGELVVDPRPHPAEPGEDLDRGDRQVRPFTRHSATMRSTESGTRAPTASSTAFAGRRDGFGRRGTAPRYRSLEANKNNPVQQDLST